MYDTLKDLDTESYLQTKCSKHKHESKKQSRDGQNANKVYIKIQKLQLATHAYSHWELIRNGLVYKSTFLHQGM